MTKCLPFSDSCLETSKSEICDKAYVGPLCQTCNIHFAKFGGVQCLRCPNSQINLLLIFLIALMIALFLTFYIKYIKDFLKKFKQFKIRINLNQLNQLKNSSFAIKKMIIASSLKIFMNYSQTITILNSLNLNWEGQLLNIFNIHKAASGSFQEVLSLECLFTGIHSVFVFFNFL